MGIEVRKSVLDGADQRQLITMMLMAMVRRTGGEFVISLDELESVANAHIIGITHGDDPNGLATGIKLTVADNRN